MFELTIVQWIFSVFVVLITCLYLWMYNRFKFWSKRGISNMPPSFPFGNFGDVIFGRESLGMSIEKAYNACKGTGPFAGYYSLATPALLAIEPESVRTILAKDFQYFQDRGIYHNEKDDPLSANLFAIEGEKWRTLRAKLTPTFTSGKLKAMFHTMLQSVAELENCMRRMVAEDAIVEVKDLLARFTTDVIGTCALGIDCNSLKDPNAEFRIIGRKIMEPNLFRNFLSAFAATCPSLGRALKIKKIDGEVSDFFLRAISDTIGYRRQNNVSRHDFIQLLMQLKDTSKPDSDESALSLEEIAAQAYIFFIGGFETTSSAMSFSLYELGLNPDIQERLRSHINQVLNKHGNELTYDALTEMDYLDMVINETLRKYPTLSMLNRECTQDYTIPGTGTVIPRGTLAFVSVGGLHHDPDIYPEPDRFDPERFTEENKAKRHKFAYLPFGEGPRVCIGVRFGMMQTRLGLITILRNYSIRRCDKTTVPLKMHPKSFLTVCLGGIWLRLEPISTT